MRETSPNQRPYRVRIFGAALLAVILSAATATVSSAGSTQQELDAAKAKLRELNRTLDQLVEGALQLIRADGSKVVAGCGFVVDYLHKHPEFADLVA